MLITAISDIHGKRLDAAADLAASSDMLLIAGDITQFGGAEAARTSLAVLGDLTNVCAVFGNCDQKNVESALVGLGVSVHAREKRCCGYAVRGFSGAPGSPFGTPGEYSEDEITAGLRSDGPPPDILLTHVPAFGTPLDVAPGVGHIGSHAIRACVEKYAPALHVCGHVHESFGIASLGASLLVNPGPYFQGRYAEIEMVQGERPAATLNMM